MELQESIHVNCMRLFDGLSDAISNGDKAY
jgi:hypothetical protein